MTTGLTKISILLIEDDEESMQLLLQSLPTEIDSYICRYSPCRDFDEAIARLEYERFDLIATDIYRDRAGEATKLETDDAATEVILALQNSQFCPILAFTDGSFPASITFQQGPFLKVVDKSKTNEIENAIAELLETGIPRISRDLHDELSRCTGPDYLWGFLLDNWDRLKDAGHTKLNVLERIIRKRAATQLARLAVDQENCQEITSVSAAEYYLMPPISPKALRLGQIVKRIKDNTIFVILTPHCYLSIQEGQDSPKVDFVLLVKSVSFSEVSKHSDQGKVLAGGSAANKEKALRRLIQLRAERAGNPIGRYSFLPGFLDIPDIYCDLLQVESYKVEDIFSLFESMAVLDTPFAESLQSQFTSFYSNVGVTPLNTEDFLHLIP